MTDRQLTGFVTVVEQNSFSAAADLLYVSQSALSQQIRQLEKQLGFALFEHSTRRAALTAAGKNFYPKAKQLLALYGRAVEEGQYLAELAQSQRRRICIACVEDQFLRVWLRFFQMTAQTSPQVSPLAVRYDSRAKLYHALHTGEADLALQLESAELRRTKLRFEPLAVVRELCLPIGDVAGLLPQRPLRPEELFPYEVAFHNHPGYSLYEDALRGYFQAHSPATRLLDPEDFFHAERRRTVLLATELQVAPHAAAGAQPLDWGNGLTLGFVFAPGCDPAICRYAEFLAESFRAQSEWRW